MVVGKKIEKPVSKKRLVNEEVENIMAGLKESSESVSKDDFGELVRLANETIEKLVNKKPLGVIGLNKEGKNWVVVVEVLERKAIPDTQDLIGKYRLSFGENKEFLGYKRTEIRKRGDTGKEFSEEEAEE